MLHLTNPCAKRKFLSLTKPKGKIYKTKSLGHYITILLVCEQISPNLFKNEVNSNLFPNKSYMYIHLYVGKNDW